MSNQLAIAGSQSQKQKARKYVPIWVNRFISGYWPNRNPLRDAVLPALTEKFYGPLNDSLIDGINCEINTRSELTRRFGNSVFNSNTAGPQQRFYSFPVFGNNTTSSYQRVLSSSATQITDITNNGATLIYAKPAGAAKTVFQSIGDTCFFSDTVAPKQLLSTILTWQASTNYIAGNTITDSNGNIQTNLGGTVSITNVAVTVSGGVSTLTIAYTGALAVSTGMTFNFLDVANAAFLNGTSVLVLSIGVGTFSGQVNFPAYASAADTGFAYTTQIPNVEMVLYNASLTSNTLTLIVGGNSFNQGLSFIVPGSTVITFSGVTNPSYQFLNGTTMTISTRVYGISTTTLTGSYTHANVTSQGIQGIATYTLTAFTSGFTQPTWGSTPTSVTIDGTTGWIYSGPSVRNVGIVAPTTAPTVLNTPAAFSGNAWAANTYYFPGQVMFDSGTVSIQQLTQKGTTAASPPSFSATPGTVTNDGSAQWTSLGTATRATNHSYATGQFILATWTKTVIVDYTGSVGPRGTSAVVPVYGTITYSAFFECISAGTSSSTATASISWPLNGNYTDGGVTWQFVGLKITRTAGSNSSPSVTSTTFTSGNISNSTLVEVVGSSITLNPLSSPVNDTVNFETVSIAGLSGSSAPTWSTTVGGNTKDNQVSWTNSGASGSAANTGYWFYSYAYVSNSTPDISSSSPLSNPIQRGANEWISVSGVTSNDPQVDTIRIYRSLQQVSAVTTLPGSEMFFIADIPMPTTSTWNYVDSSNDPPDPSSTMDTFIIADLEDINTPPLPSITNFVYYLGRLWGSIGNTVYASAGPDVVNDGNPFTAFPQNNFMDFPSTVVRMLASSQGLMVYTAAGVQIITGNGISSTGSGFTTFVPVSYADGICLGGYDGLTVDGATTYIYTSDHNILSLSSSGLNWISTAISNKLQSSFTLPDNTTVNFDPANTYLSWYVHGDDYGLFISDGTTGWFRMMPSTSPDSGNMVWSPFAEIAGGVSAVQNIQTAIGVYNLLIGPGTSGPILKRDNTASTDNGTTFSWSATFGSVVLAHPGEVAMIQSIVIDSLKQGSHPSITVCFDEINSTGKSYLYTDYVYDPYDTLISDTVNADRFFMSDDPDAVAICRHMQVAINFPAEAVQNTVLSSTIIGATEYNN